MTRTGRRTGSRFRWAVGRASTCPFLTRLERARSSTRRQGSSSRASSDGPATRCRRKQRVHRFGVGPDAGSRAWPSARGAAARRAGRGWAKSSCRSRNARRSTTACAFLNSEIASGDRVIAHDALNWPEARRLLTVPGVNLIAAGTFLAAIGNIERFPDRRKLVGYLGLDPKVRQSGDAPAAYGHISKQGSAAVRHALVEARIAAEKRVVVDRQAASDNYELMPPRMRRTCRRPATPFARDAARRPPSARARRLRSRRGPDRRSAICGRFEDGRWLVPSAYRAGSADASHIALLSPLAQRPPDTPYPDAHGSGRRRTPSPRGRPPSRPWTPAHALERHRDSPPARK